MIKTLTLTTAIVATSMSLMASAASASSNCSAQFEPVSRINPTELSDHGKCVAEYYGTTSGTIGKYLWVKAGDTYAYIPLVNLQGKSHSAIKKIIMSEVMVSSLEDKLAKLTAEVAVLGGLAEQLPDLNDRLAAMTKERDQLLLVVATLKGDVSTLEDALAVMTADRDRIQGLLDDANIDIATLEAQQSQLQSNVHEIFEDYLGDFLTDNNIITADQLFKANGALTTAASSALFGFLDQAVADANALASISAEMQKSTYDQFDWDEESSIAQNVQSLLLDNEFHGDMLDTIRAHMETYTDFTWDNNAGWTNNVNTFVAMVNQMEADQTAFEHAKTEMSAFSWFSWDSTLTDIQNIDAFILKVDKHYLALDDAEDALNAFINDANVTFTWSASDLTVAQKIGEMHAEIRSLQEKITLANAIAVDGYDATNLVPSTVTVDSGAAEASHTITAITKHLYNGTFVDTNYTDVDTGQNINWAGVDTIEYRELISEPGYADGWYVILDDGNQGRQHILMDSQAEAMALAMQMTDAADQLSIYTQNLTAADLPTTLAELKSIIDQVAADAYAAGYTNGYNDGYSDGYKDGYAQGVTDTQAALN